MKRNMSKTVSEFYNMNNSSNFCSSDIQSISDMSSNKWQCIINALCAGYVIGYKTAKREAKKLNEGRC